MSAPQRLDPPLVRWASPAARLLCCVVLVASVATAPLGRPSAQLAAGAVALLAILVARPHAWQLARRAAPGLGIVLALVLPLLLGGRTAQASGIAVRASLAILEVAFGPRQRGVTETQVTEATHQALTTVGLADFGSRSPRQLSLGEQRRLAVATALACRPRLLLIDEPTASLDPVARQAMLETIAGLDATVIMATHDLDAALALNAEVVLMQEGRLVRTGPAAQILTDAELLQRAGLLLPISIAARRQPQEAGP